MTHLRIRTIICLLPIVAVLGFAGASRAADQRPAIAKKVAKTFGIDSWSRVEAIRYTFNAQSAAGTRSRSWIWEPKTDRVSYEGPDKSGAPVKVTYLRKDLGSQPANVKEDIDSAFWNDQYWLLLPFHAIWDSTATVSDAGKQKLPLGDGTAEQIVIKYPAEAGGYSPGDTWDMFVGPDGRLKVMGYHRVGPQGFDLFATWDGYKKAGPLLIATEHQGVRNNSQQVHISFTNVAVKLAGSNTWQEAK